MFTDSLNRYCTVFKLFTLWWVWYQKPSFSVPESQRLPVYTMKLILDIWMLLETIKLLDINYQPSPPLTPPPLFYKVAIPLIISSECMFAYISAYLILETLTTLLIRMRCGLFSQLWKVRLYLNPAGPAALGPSCPTVPLRISFCDAPAQCSFICHATLLGLGMVGQAVTFSGNSLTA